MPDRLSLLDLCAQADLVRRGECKPLELVDAAIARIERLDPRLGCVVSLRFERARAEAASPELPDGPLRGVPFLLKDLGAHLAGDAVCCGMQALLRAGWREPGESYFAGKLRRAGAIVLGRTNTPELGLLPTTEPAAFPPSRNPWETGHSAGGSSGGSAAAVAAGLVAAAHASDGGGSIRIPASHCGLVGLKPSRGRCSFGPDLGERWGGYSVEGFVSRSVRDTAALLDVVQGPMPGDPYAAPPPARAYLEEAGADPGRLRVGLMTRAPRGGELDPECAEAARRAARALEALGHRVEESAPAALDEAAAVGAFVTVIAASTARALEAWGAKLGRRLGEGDVEPGTWAMAEAGRARSGVEYAAAIEFGHAYGRRLASWWSDDGFDLLVTPTCAAPPPPLGHFAPAPGDPQQGMRRAVPYSTFTSSFNMTGQPALSLPLHWSAAGLPIGAQLVAAQGREDLLIRVAAQLELAVPWGDRLPPLHASR